MNDKQKKRPTAKYVRQWADAGFRFIKLKKNSKHPVKKAWGKHLIDADEIIPWIKSGGNYGIVIGPEWVILDADARHDGFAKIQAFIADNDLDIDFSTVPTIRTGGYDKRTKRFGRHLLFRKDTEVAVVSEDKTWGLEWRSSRKGTQGRYVVGVGSVHPDSGAYYKPLNGVLPADAPMLPAAALDKIAKKAKNPDGSEIVEAGKHSAEELEAMLGGLPVEDFNSNETWWQVMCAAHHAVGGSEDGKQVFLDWCDGDSAYSHAREMNEMRWDSLSNGEKSSLITVATLYKLLHEREQGNLIPRDVMNEDDFPDEWPHEIDWSDTSDAALFGKRFLRHRPAPVVTTIGEDIFTYDRGLRLWQPTSERALKSEIISTDQNSESLLSGNLVAGMIERIRSETFTTAMPGEWITQPEEAPAAADLIPFSNGLLNRVTGKLVPYTPDFFVTGRADYDYDPDVRCPTFDAFLSSSLEPEFHNVVEEMLGYCFYGAAPAHVIFVLSGVPRGGKSTLMHIAKELVGDSSATTVEIKNFASRFGLSETPGKRVILVPDADKMQGRESSAVMTKLKQWSGGDDVQVDRKNEKLIMVKPTGKIIVGCNEKPDFVDESGALAMRFRHIEFTRSFVGKEDATLPGRLLAELPGIANRALAGLKRLESQGWKFSVGSRGKEIADEAQMGQQLVGRFARDCGLKFSGDPLDRILRDKVFSLWLDWCGDENVSIKLRQNKTQFVNSLIAASMHRAKEALVYPTEAEREWLREQDKNKSPHRKIRVLRGVRDPDEL